MYSVESYNVVRTDDDIHQAVKLWCSNFYKAFNKYGHISNWDTSDNQSLSNWNVSNVTIMKDMFD